MPPLRNLYQSFKPRIFAGVRRIHVYTLLLAFVLVDRYKVTIIGGLDRWQSPAAEQTEHVFIYKTFENWQVNFS